jgi:hypothetical protein
MIRLLRGLGRAVVGVAALAAPALAQTSPDQPASNPVCVRLESQLTSIDRGGADPRAEQLRRAEEAVAKQQADLEAMIERSRRAGCEGIGGFFALFTGQAPQCAPLNSQIQQIRGNLDRAMSDLERLKSGSNGQDMQRRALISQLAQNNCGPQYRAAAAQSGPTSFLDAIFGGSIINPGGDGAPSGTYHTVCVRTCDGYYFPISYSTVPSHFTEDQRACQRQCPAAEAVLYSYRNPGEDIGQAVSITGNAYTALPNAFRYRREFTASCSCRRPGQSWADALKNADDSSTLERGDIVVTDQKAKALSQTPPPAPPGKPPKGAANSQPTTPAAGDTTATTPVVPNASDPVSTAPKGTVRTVGPPFIPAH